MTRPRDRVTARSLALGLAALTAVGVWVIATTVFPYHSLNHDEAVYLQQAAMLVEGKVTLQPPVSEVFRPWFFVADGATLYPKYAPVTAALFAPGVLIGLPRLALAVIGGLTVLLLFATVAEVFDRPTGLVAALLLAASPLFLVQASVFLPYVPALCLNLLFAWAYLRADRTGDRRWAALAGVAIGTAFFARPYTAVLFATPFVVHAVWTLRSLDRPVLGRQLVTAILGLAGVGVALAYNAAMTGDPLTFPYQAFAPADGVGFGHRELLGYERNYTVWLGLRAMWGNLATFVSTWVVAAPLGALLAVAGLGAVLREEGRSVSSRTLALAGLGVSIPLGGVAFWGTLNVLGDLSVTGDGLVSVLGPYYHVGLLVPTTAFGAHALVRAGRWSHRRWRRGADRLAGPVLAVLIVGAALGSGGFAAAALAGPLSENAGVTAEYDAAYAPVETSDLDDALVLLPPVYGEWLNHPFQYLRNDPDYDGAVLYALGTRELAVAEAFGQRQLYRYVYRGTWAPTQGPPVDARLQPVERVTGDRVALAVDADMPRFAQQATLSVAAAGERAYATVTRPGDRVALTIRVSSERVRVTGPSLVEPVTVPVQGRETVDVGLLVDSGGVATFSYEVAVPVDTGTQVTALTPVLRVCRRAGQCDHGSAYVPGAHRPGIGLTTRFVDRAGTTGAALRDRP